MMELGLFDFLKKKGTKDVLSVHPNDASGVNATLGTSMSSGEMMEIDGMIPLEERIKSAVCSKNGLYPHEILVLDYANHFCTQNNKYQRFWQTRYGVENVDKVLHDLLSKGFITIASIDVTLRKKTLVELRAVLDGHGLNSRGKKEELIHRIMNEISCGELKELFPDRFYVRTEKGETELKEQEYIPYIHRHSIQDLDIWNLNKLVHVSTGCTYKDVIWKYLTQQSIEYITSKKYGLYRSCRCSMAQFLEEEGRLGEELEMLSEVVFYDLSGADDNYNPEILYITASHLFPYEHSLARVAPGIINKIFSCQEKLNLSDMMLKEILMNHMRDLFAPLQLFTIDECAEIVFYERVGDMKALEHLYRIAEKRFYSEHPDLI